MTTPQPTVVAVDVGGTNTRLAVVQGGRMVGRMVFATVTGAGLADSLTQAIIELLGRRRVALQDVAAVGVSVPGPLDAARRQVVFSGNVALQAYPLAERLEAALRSPVVMDDDANCAALAEATWGAARRATVAALIVIGTGIGCGIVLDGAILRGAHGAAGELGHAPLERDGPLCSCGHRGCFEALAAGPALAARGTAAMLAGSAPVLAELAGGQTARVDATATLRAAALGDPGAEAAVRETGRYVGMGVATVADLLDPEVIVLAGGLGGTPAMLTAARLGVKDNCIPPMEALVRVEPATLGDDAGLWGAAQLALRSAQASGPPVDAGPLETTTMGGS
jgi:glucokinase